MKKQDMEKEIAATEQAIKSLQEKLKEQHAQLGAVMCPYKLGETLVVTPACSNAYSVDFPFHLRVGRSCRIMGATTENLLPGYLDLTIEICMEDGRAERDSVLGITPRQIRKYFKREVGP
jgi:hypothetical protein